MPMMAWLVDMPMESLPGDKQFLQAYTA